MNPATLQTLAADALVLLHFAFILFVVFGGLLVFRWPWAAFIHLPAAAWGAVIEFAGWICPLTPLEQKLRQAGGEMAYGGGFIDHYVLPLMYPDGLTRTSQFYLGFAVLILNAAIYGGWYYRSRK
jgi:hypothetical protein